MSTVLPPPTALSFTLPAPDLSAWRAGNTGTPGVWHFDSGVPGRHVMISALVHGNELCGAWALKGLLEAALRPQKGQQGLGLGRLCGGIVPLAGKDGDGFGRKKRVEVVLVHGGYFGLSANLVSMSP